MILKLQLIAEPAPRISRPTLATMTICAKKPSHSENLFFHVADLIFSCQHEKEVLQHEKISQDPEAPINCRAGPQDFTVHARPRACRPEPQNGAENDPKMDPSESPKSSKTL